MRRSSDPLNASVLNARRLPYWKRQTVAMLEKKVINSDPEILGGTPVFSGTRVPIKSLVDHLEAGDSIEDFLEGLPSVRRDQVIALLELLG